MSFRDMLKDATSSNRPSADIARDRLHLVLHEDRTRTRKQPRLFSPGVEASMIIGAVYTCVAAYPKGPRE